MYVERWIDFINVMYAVTPSLSGSDRENVGTVISWAYSQRPNYTGISQASINYTATWIRTIRDRSTGEMRNDLSRALSFLVLLNTVRPANTFFTEVGCLYFNHYWYSNTCHADPEAIPAPPLPPPPPPPPEPDDPGIFDQLEYNTDVLIWFTDQDGYNIAQDIERNYGEWYDKLGGYYEYATILAALSSMSTHIDMALLQVSVNFELLETWIGDIRRLEGDSIIDAIRDLQAGVTTETGAQTKALYRWLEMYYNEDYDTVSRITGGLMDNLVTIVDQWVDQGEKLGEVSSQDIANILNNVYKIHFDTIDNIYARLNNIEREIGIVTEEVIVDIDKPIFEEGNIVELVIPASVAWVRAELKRLCDAVFDAMDLMIDTFTKPINALLHHVYDISEPWLAALKEKLGDVGGEYDLEADPAFQLIRSEVNVLIDEVYEMSEGWVSILANRLEGYFSTGIGEKGEKGDPGLPGAQGVPGIPGVKGEKGEPGEGAGMAIEDIDSQLKERLVFGAAIVTNNVTGVIDYNIEKIGEIFTRYDLEVKPITEFLTTDMQESLTGIIEAFDTPEALIAFLLDVPEGQEDVTYELMQLLIAQTMERGLE